jgi:hypothetical protein
LPGTHPLEHEDYLLNHEDREGWLFVSDKELSVCMIQSTLRALRG